MMTMISMKNLNNPLGKVSRLPSLGKIGKNTLKIN